jgi:hypothetical protein
LTINTNRSSQLDSDFGVRPANYAVKLANICDKPVNDISPLSFSSCLPSHSSKSKVIKKHSIHLIRFCLKNGITKNKEIVRLLKENEIVLKGRTFDRYKSLAEKELENELGEDFWLSDKVQNGLVHDYKDISDRYDRQLVMDDVLMQSMIKLAVDKAIKVDDDPNKYYAYLDFNEIVKIQAISNYTMKNKLELISKGFMVYKIKQHIEYLRKQLTQKENKNESIEAGLDLASLSFLPTSDSSPQVQEGCQSNDNELNNEEYDKDYLDQNDLAIGMNGRPIKKYLVDIEKRLGKPLSTI